MLRYRSLCSQPPPPPPQQGRGVNLSFGQNFPESCMKMKGIGPGGPVSGAPITSAKITLIKTNKKSFVRSGIRTHARIRGPEHPLAFAGKDFLESGALDHSAILTTGITIDFPFFRFIIIIIIIWRCEHIAAVADPVCGQADPNLFWDFSLV